MSDSSLYPLITENIRMMDQVASYRRIIWNGGDPWIDSHTWDTREGRWVPIRVCRYCESHADQDHDAYCPWLAEKLRRDSVAEQARLVAAPGEVDRREGVVGEPEQ